VRTVLCGALVAAAALVVSPVAASAVAPAGSAPASVAPAADTTPPSAPPNFRTVNDAQGRPVSFAWDNPNGESVQVYWFHDAITGEYTNIYGYYVGDPNVNVSYNISKGRLTPGETRSMYILAQDSAGNLSEPSNSITFTVPDL